MDIDSLVHHIKTKDFYADIASDVELRFDVSGYDKADARPLPIELNRKVMGLCMGKKKFKTPTPPRGL